MKKISVVIVLFLLVFTSLKCDAKRQYPEKYYQNLWCSTWNGKQEVELFDYTRVDCITKNYAVEFDFAKKWAECLGQALHYGDITGKKPACILIIENPKDYARLYKTKPTFNRHGVMLWYMQAPDYKEN